MALRMVYDEHEPYVYNDQEPVYYNFEEDKRDNMREVKEPKAVKEPKEPSGFVSPLDDVMKQSEDFVKCMKENLEKVEPREMVNHPEHYNGDSPYECIKVLKAWMSEDEYIGFLKGNALKYLCRAGKKDDIDQDLRKAKWYLDKLVEEIGE